MHYALLMVEGGYETFHRFCHLNSWLKQYLGERVPSPTGSLSVFLVLELGWLRIQPPNTNKICPQKSNYLPSVTHLKKPHPMSQNVKNMRQWNNCLFFTLRTMTYILQLVGTFLSTSCEGAIIALNDKTLPKAQRTQGWSFAYQSNKFLHKSWSNSKIQNLNQTLN